MEPDNKQVEQESDYLVSDDLLPDGMTVDQLRAEIIEQASGHYNRGARSSRVLIRKMPCGFF